MATVEPSYRVYTHRHPCLSCPPCGLCPFLYHWILYTRMMRKNHTWPVKRYLNFNLAQLANMEREGLRSYTATGHKGVIQMSQRRLQLVVLLPIDQKNNKQHQEHCRYIIHFFYLFISLSFWCLKFYSKCAFLRLRLNFCCSETNHRRPQQGHQPLIQSEN